MRGRWVPVGVVLALVVGLAGCSSEGVNRRHGVPILGSEVHGPGSRLGSGLRVPDGAVLAGAVLPAQAPHAVGWIALLGVGGSPRAVTTALLDQARVAGFRRLPTEPFCDAGGCSFSNHTYVDADGRVRAPDTGRFLDVHVEAHGRHGTWGSVRYLRRGGSDPRGAAPVVGSEGEPPLPVRPARGRLPQTGDRIGLYDWTPRVEGGSHMVLPAVSTGGTTVALLEVDSSPRGVYAAYVLQLERRDASGRAAAVVSRRVGGWRVVSTSAGGIRDIELFTRGDRSYLVLSTVND